MFIRFYSRFGQPVYSADKGDGADPPANQQQKQDEPPAWLAGLQSLIARSGGDTNRVAERLYDENHSYRQQVRELQGKVPPEGALVLTGDDKTAYEAWKALGTPDEIKTALDERTTLKERVAKQDRLDILAKAAAPYGYKASVLDKLPNFDKPVETEEKDGAVTAAFVKDGEQRIALPDYLTKHYAEFMPSIVATEQQQRGTAWPEQDKSRRGGQQSVVQGYMKNTYKVPGQKE